MNFERLLELQKTLDDRILDEHHLHTSDLFSRKLLALQVEVGELANETRCFKFWSTKSPAPKEIILEEYVDGIHFILSLGLELGISEVSSYEQKDVSQSPVIAFQEVYHAIDILRENQNVESFHVLLEKYLQLAIAIDLNIDAIERAYLKKNEINHQRQNQGY
ncbi:dUTP diphosphatase [Alkalihalobacillus sp. R86527]|uniref:dUTP diphosphatase n=1 Tax=Alkalihalobacillus sp. R86527 TaxID=3093863 RepID=UPI00366AE8A9